MESQNPMLSKNRLGRMHVAASQACTIDGTMTAATWLLLIVMTVGALTWFALGSGALPDAVLLPVFILSLIVGLGVVIALMFKPQWAPICAPIYAVAEGIFLGAVSLLFETMYPGIVTQAVLLTLAVALLMFTLYRTQIIKVTQKFRTVVILATLAIGVVYLISIILSLFKINIPLIYDSGPIGIIFSLVVVTIAALNLLLDFDLVEQVVKQRYPKYMEWYCAFALLVTIVWLYIEILRLLAKLRER